MSSTPFHTCPAIRVRQPLSSFIIAAVPARVLLATAFSHRLRAIAQPNGSYKLEGSQRLIHPDRLKDIAGFIESPEAAFPNAIILAANVTESRSDSVEEEEELSKSWDFEPDNGADSGILVIPTSEKMAAIIDGQHRLFGFNSVKSDRLEMPLVCAIYFDLPKAYQAYLFATINAKQRPVDKSQTYELFGYSLDEEPAETWTPDKLAVFLARKLNWDPESKLRRHIIIPAEHEADSQMGMDEVPIKWTVSLATVVEGILQLISSNPREDALAMLDGAFSSRSRTRLKAQPPSARAPLREFFRATNDTVVYTGLVNFFSAVANVFWSKENPGFIQKTVGIQALFDILRQIVVEAITAEDISAEFFQQRLMPAGYIDFTDNFFHASGAGKTRIKKCIEFALGLRKQAELVNLKDAQDYRRVLGWKNFAAQPGGHGA
jgi:DNA phosphorothioation-associated DGQHR protein 1